MNKLNLILIFAVFLLAMPIAFAQMVLNETFTADNNKKNWSLTPECTINSGGSGLLECSGGNNGVALFVHQIPCLNLSSNTGNCTMEFYDLNYAATANTHNHFACYNKNHTPFEGAASFFNIVGSTTANKIMISSGIIKDIADPAVNHSMKLHVLRNESISVDINGTNVVNIPTTSDIPSRGSFCMFITQPLSSTKVKGIAIYYNGTTSEPAASDTTPPIVNTSFNITSPKINDVNNITCKISDETGLSTANITINFTTGTVKKNYTISGTSATINNITKMTDSRGNVNNITCYATDTSNNVKQNSTLFTIANTIPTHSAPKLNASIGLNRTDENLTGYNQSGADIDGDKIVFGYNWYKNKVRNATRWINDSSLVLYLPFDDNSTDDYAGDNDGVRTKGVNITPEGKIRDAMMFNSSADITLNHLNSTINTPTATFSVCLWFNANPKGAVTDHLIGRLTGSNSGSRQPAILIDSSNNLSFMINHLTQADFVLETEAIESNRWYHTCAVYDGINSMSYLYLDGVVNKSTSMTPDLFVSGTSTMRIGSQAGIGSNEFDGIIDELGIWNKSLSASEIMQIYQGTRDGFAVLDSDQTARGENWTIEITPYDSSDSGSPLNSTQLTIANTVPSFTSASISQTAPNTTTTLTTTTSGYSDPDSDVESGSTYKWYKNSVVIAGETTTSLAGTNFIRTDVIIFEAAPNDGFGAGSPVNSSSVTIVDAVANVSIGINNTSPKKNDVVNVSSNISDSDTVDWCLIKTNKTGASTNNTFYINSIKGFCSDPITITTTRGNVINFTIQANDTVGNIIYENSTLITVANTIPTFTSVILNSSDGTNRTTANLTGYNQSGSDADSDVIVFNYNWYKNKVYNATRWINDSSLVLYLPFDDNSTLDFVRNNDGTAVNGANGTPEGKIGDGYMFDGVNDAITTNLNLSQLSGNISLSAWVYRNSRIDGDAIFGGDASTQHMLIRFNSNSDTLSYFTNSSIGGKTIATGLTKNNWWHIVVNFNRTATGNMSAEAYVNGIFNGSGMTAGTWNTGANTLRIGRRGTTADHYNGTIDEIAIYNRSLSASEIMQIYQGTRDGFGVMDSDQTAKGENWTIEMTPYDVDGSGTPLNSTQLTILNTAPNGTNFVNTTGKHYNTNITRLNWTPASDNDLDTLRYVVYWDLDITPTSVYYNGTDLNISTNWTSDNTYFYQIKVMDDISESALSPVFNLTLDTGLPTLTNNCTNNTFTRLNLTCQFSIEDPFPYNLSILVNRNGNDYHLKTNSTAIGRFINITFLMNLTEDGNYTIYVNASDSDKTSPKIDDNLKDTKKGEAEYVMNDTINTISYKMLIRFEDKNENEITTSADYKSYSSYNSKGTHIDFGMNFTANKNIMIPVYEISTENVNINILNDSIKGHLIWFPYGTDFEGKLLVNGIERNYTVSIKRLTSTRVKISIIPIIDIANNDVVQFRSESIFGLNTIDVFYNIVNDQTAPNIFNITPLNNTFIGIAVNFTANITETNPDKMELWINSTGTWHLNRTASYQNNITANFSLFNLSDGIYKWTVCANDTAGGYSCFAENYTITIDTLSPSITLESPFNNTVMSAGEKPNVNFRISSNEDVKNCSVFLASSLVGNESTQKQSHNFTVNSIAGGVYTWNAACYDLANNLGASRIFNLEIKIVSGGSSSIPEPAGGGGGIGVIPSIDEPEIIDKGYTMTYICGKVKKFLNDKPNYDLSSIVLLQEDIRFEINFIIPFTTLKGYVDSYEQFCGVKNQEEVITTENKTQQPIVQSISDRFSKMVEFGFGTYIKLPFQADFGKLGSYGKNVVGLFDFANIFLPLSVSDNSENPNVVWEGGIRIFPPVILVIIIIVAVAITRIYRSNKKLDLLSSVENAKKDKK